MKNLFILFIILTGFQAQSVHTDITAKMQKTINKELKKSWKDIVITQRPITINPKVTCKLSMDLSNTFVLLNYKDTLGYLFVRRTKGCVIGGCDNSSKKISYYGVDNNFEERYEHFDYMAILNTDLSVRKVKVLVYEGEYGYEVTSKLWLKQFIGYKGGKLKYGSDVQALSGATVSAQSITNDIQDLVKSAKELRAMGVF